MRPAAALDPGQVLTQFGLDVWQRRQGLPQSLVSAIAQTSDGYLWFGTEEGLARFDGVRFVVFDQRNTPELKRRHITCLRASRDGGLWIGTLGGGLLRWEKGRFTSFTTANGLPEDIVSALMEDSSGTLWIGTFSKGVVRLARGAFSRLTRADGLSNDEVRALAQDAGGDVWIGTRGGGLNRYRDGRFSAWTTQNGLVHDQVTALTFDRSGALWIATRGGVSRLAGDSLTSFTARDGLASDSAISLASDRDGNVWIGTAGGGVQRFADGRLTTLGRREGLTGDTVLALLEDRDGSLWIGASGGLSRLRPGRFIVTGTAEGLSADDVRPVLQDRSGAMWIGTLGGGVNRLADGRITSFRVKDGLLSDRVWALHEDAAGAIWVGTREGLNRYAGGRWAAYTTKDGLSHNLVLAIGSDAAGGLWIGTAGGLDRLRDGRFTAYGRAEGLTNERVDAIATAPDGSLWVGTMGGGVNRLVDGRVAPLAQGPLAKSFVNVIAPAPDGSVWVGTGGDGLYRWKAGRWDVFTAADGLFDDVVWTILDDGRGNLWLSSNRGVARVATADLERFAAGDRRKIPSVAYDASDGFKEAECNGGFQPAGWKSRDGRLWFPTIKGLATVDPSKVAPATAPPPVFIEEVVVDEERIPADRFARLTPGRDRIQFHYTALAFPAPEKLQFRYKLEGFDHDWVDAGARRAATYTNLRPGSYRFRVQAVNGEGVRNESGASFAFSLAPHFYRTPWFIGVVALALLAAAVSLHRARVRAAELQTQLAAARLQALKAQLQPHFLFNTLNMILPLIYRDPRSAARSLVQLGDLLRQSLERDATKLVSLREELDFLQKYLDIQRVRFQSRFSTDFRVDEDVLDAAIPNLLLQPLVENAIKHGISKHRGAGRIELTCGRRAEFLSVRLWNTSGADDEGPSNHSHGIGLSNIRERLDVIYGGRYRFSRASVPGGFEVTLELPLDILPRQSGQPDPAAVSDPARETA